MDRDKGKNLGLNIAIGLAIILLVALVIIFSKTRQEKGKPIKETTVKKEVVAPKQRPPLPPMPEESEYVEKGPAPAEEIVDPEEKKEEGREEVMMLRDLPLDSIDEKEMLRLEEARSEETGIQEEEAKSTLKTQPNYEDMKLLQKKNLIIY